MDIEDLASRRQEITVDELFSYYRRQLLFRVENPKARLRKLYWYQEQEGSHARKLLNDLDTYLTNRQLVINRESVDDYLQLSESGRRFLDEGRNRLFVKLGEAFYFEALSPCPNPVVNYLQTGWQKNKSSAQVLLMSCFTLADTSFEEEPEEKHLLNTEIWVPSYVGITRTGKTLCPVCGYEPKEKL